MSTRRSVSDAFANRALIVDDLRSSVSTDNHCIMSYSFHGCENDSNCVRNVLRNLLHQALYNIQGIPADVQSLRLRFRQQYTLSLPEIVRALVAACSSYNECFLVLDGLDECSHRARLLPELRNLKSSGLRILLTSRYLPDIRGATIDNVYLHMRAAATDIELYISKRLEELDCHDSPVETGVNKDIITKVTNHADGM